MTRTAGAATSAGGVLHWARTYDVVAWVLTLGKERAFRDYLADLSRLAPGQSVLDVGCGTGRWPWPRDGASALPGTYAAPMRRPR